ncbi:MAG: tape measure protein [Pseudomonas sp.]|nr:tape measure protein [Pseudomonas sp.]
MAGIKERLIQVVLRGKDMLSSEAGKSADALDALRETGEQLQEALGRTEGAAKLADQLDQTRTVVERATGAYDKAQDDVARLRRELDAAPDSMGLQTSLREAERYARSAGRELDRLRDAERELEQQARQAGVATDALGAEQDRLQGEVARAKRALDDNAAALDELRRKQAAAAAGAAEHVSRVSAARAAMSGGMRQVLAFAAAYISLDAAIGLVTRGIDAIRAGIGNMLQAGDGSEALQARMTSLMGSIAAGEQATAWISEFAKQTPLATAEVADAFMLLKSYGLDPMDGTLQSLVDKNEQLGGGMDRLTGIVTALGQAFAKSKLQTEEILQLVERGVPAWDLLAKVTGKNAAELEKLASEGRLGRDVIKSLVAELGKSADGAAAEGMSRLSGLMSQLSDTAGDFYKRIANAGALDYVKGKLQGVINTIGQMDKDGRLDKLAKALSDAFIQGAEKAEEFAKRLAGTDFNKLIDDSSAWLSNFGRQIDEVTTRVQLFVAPFRSLFNGITSGVALYGTAITSFAGVVLGAFAQIAKAVPNMMGGEKLRASIAEARGALDAMRDGFVEQIEQDGKDTRSAWDTTTNYIVRSSEQAAAAQAAAAGQAKDAWQKAAEAGMVSNDQMRDAIVQAAVDGSQAITDMAGALELIDTASTVQQVDALRGVLFKAYQHGKLSLEEYQQATGVLGGRLAELGQAAGGAAGLVSELEDKLGSLADVQQAIASAKTDVDINAIKKALRELYEGGKITAAEYNEELQNVTTRQKELKGAVEQTASAGQQAGEQLTKSQQMYNAALEDSILTNEELRRISGQRMEEERRSSGELMEMQRKGHVVVERDMAAMEDFFGSMVTRAREPLAAMSDAALEAFDRLSGISTVNLELDTSSLEATSDSLQRATEALREMQEMAGTATLSGFSKWMAATQLQSQQIQVQFLGQKQSLQQLMEGYESGSGSLEAFVREAKAARSGLSLLNDSDLRTLESAIASAEQRLQSLSDSGRNALASVQDELDRLQGREDAVEERRFAQRRRELEMQRAEARAAGNSAAASDLSQALSMLSDIEAETQQQRFAQQQQQRQAQQQQAVPAAQQPTPPAKIIRLESRGRAVDVPVSSDRDEINLLGILEDAGLRTIR